ncbi:CD276 antigen-like isoform X1 [Oncorhynchus tshawytscha]|uniref:Ig-like domain-containing protein n=2 Tax=Oncorhynchus tshawytscha TaxID=74940 RepID=A0A8C8D9P2_ONCTS|nr:CD276 antigen-like isoform X1 [Oncorhynchus tshawytscha]XP_024260011.1 CD276 antigen-like isoform X1 [Oncorhynchus tshawytscha]XP_024260012.1 CD276 antigen-like isoform X1 [Oncorhynchus tshawytscha]
MLCLTRLTRAAETLRKTMLSLLLPTLLAVQALAVLEVYVPELPVVALYGMDTTLNCSFSHASPFNLSDLSVFWQLTDTKRSVHSYWASQDQLADQGERYANRTSLYPSQLGAGNASLLLRGVRVADEVSYTCFVRVKDYGSAALLLQVAAPYSKPLVTLEPDSNLRPGDEVALTCVAYGGYPEADVLWQDGGGHNLTDNVTTSLVANEEGLFSMLSVLTVTLEPNSTYSCRLTNPLLGEDGHASVTITGQNMVFPPVALWVTVGLAVCLLGLLIALAAVCRRKIKESCEEDRAAKELEEAKELQEEEQSKTAMTPLKS